VKRKRRLEIVVETQRRFRLRKPGLAPTVLCEQCSAPLVLVQETVAITGLSSRTIHRMVETGEVHFTETPAGALLICLNSFRSIAGEAEKESLPQLFFTKGKFQND